jgi:DHA1 family multidrug resistance protein-like MFS transporter
MRDLERNPTVLERKQTSKSQHAGTVGGTTRTKTRDSRRPMPEMGLGKPFPQPLPAQEEYVVEFDGPDDPLHAMNWPMRKK